MLYHLQASECISPYILGLRDPLLSCWSEIGLSIHLQNRCLQKISSLGPTETGEQIATIRTGRGSGKIEYFYTNLIDKDIDNVLLSQDTTQLVETAEVAARQSRRVKSLDAFRGLSITVMIFVNYGGGSYYFFNHSPWNGLTVADLVFPWFVWIMGVSLAISTQSRLRNSVPRRQLVLRVLKRSAILILLGLIINSRGGGNDLRTLRLPGVLQRFGLTYVVVGVAESLLLPRQFPEQSPAPQLLDLTSSGWQWLAAVLSLGLYTAVTLLLPVPGCPTGYLGPGGLADGGAHR